MEDIISTLVRIEKEYGEQIFSDKSRLMAIVKDYLPEDKREQRLIEKGLEINLYERLKVLSLKEIGIYYHRVVRELCDEHGLNKNFAEQVLKIWVGFVERKRNKTSYEGLAPNDRGRMIAAYNKNAENKTEQPLENSAAYEVSRKDDGAKSPSGGFRLNRAPDKTVLYEIRRERDDNDYADYGKEELIDLCVSRAENEDVAAQSILGDLYYRGTVVKKNFKEAVKWFERAAAHGDQKAQNNLAYCYFYGSGVKKNVPLAIQWFTKAAKQGELSAMLSIANCYYGGIGVERDVSKALPWYIRAAELGNADAQYIIGECYYKGEGFQRDRVEAVKWYTRAANQNHIDAKEKLEELERYKKVIDSRFHDNVLETNTLLYVERFTSKVVSRLLGTALLEKLSIYGHGNNILPDITNPLTGLGIRLRDKERPILFFNDTKGNLLRLSDAVVLTIMGLYIHRPMRRRRFIYYADIDTIQVLEEEKKVLINNTTFNCVTLETEEMYAFTALLRDVIKEFK